MKSIVASGNPVRINGFNYNWANISILLGSVLPVIGVTEISYKEKADITPAYGFGNTPIAYSVKNLTYEGSITLYKDELPALQNAARIQNPLNTTGSISGILPFTVVVSMISPDGVKTTTDTILDVMFLENGVETKQGDGEIMVKIPFICSEIQFGI